MTTDEATAHKKTLSLFFAKFVNNILYIGFVHTKMRAYILQKDYIIVIERAHTEIG